MSNDDVMDMTYKEPRFLSMEEARRLGISGVSNNLGKTVSTTTFGTENGKRMNPRCRIKPDRQSLT